MQELIEKLEKATEPDREIDLAIAVILQPEGDIAKTVKFRRGFDGREGMAWDLWANAVCFEKYTADGQCFFNGGYPLPQYTASIDAALTLVPDGLLVSMTLGHGKAAVNVKTGSIINPETKEWSGYGTAPNAICIAALKAREALQQQAAA